jgi:hypothetical protein
MQPFSTRNMMSRAGPGCLAVFRAFAGSGADGFTVNDVVMRQMMWDILVFEKAS